MGIKCKEVINFLEKMAPASLAEDWDNVGLLVGSPGKEIGRIMTCLDVTSSVVEEAIQKKADLIVSHHPLIFKGLKRINEDDPKGSIIYKLVKNDIAVYSSHTNMDMAEEGLNFYLATLLGLSDIKGLNTYKCNDLYKLVVFVPENSIDQVRDAICGSGAGWIGNYSDCSFAASGTGTFRPLEGTNPYIGTKGNLEKVNEYRLETIVPQINLNRVLDAMLKAHPYEEVAYDLYKLEQPSKSYSLGNTGTLGAPQTLEEFISTVKNKLGIKSVRLIGKADRIKQVAVFCGSFDESFIRDFRKSGADVLVTGDIKYHIAMDMADMGLCVIDAGHFATERIFVPWLAEKLSKEFQELDIICNTVETDPIKIC